MNTVGIKIKERRIALGLTQDELAKRMGYACRSTVAKAEAADDKALNTRTVAKYAKFLNCTPAYLMGWEDEPNKKIENETLQDFGMITADKEGLIRYIELAKKIEQLPENTRQSIISLINSVG